MQSSLYRSLVIVILAQGVMLGFMPHHDPTSENHPRAAFL